MTEKKRRFIQRLVTSACSLFFMVAGSFHFLNPEPFVEIMPEVLPFPLALVYISGFFEILGGLGLLFARTRQKASWGLLALLIAVFPANLNMAINSIDFGLPHEWLWWRLPLQVVFVLWVWCAGRD